MVHATMIVCARDPWSTPCDPVPTLRSREVVPAGALAAGAGHGLRKLLASHALGVVRRRDGTDGAFLTRLATYTAGTLQQGHPRHALACVVPRLRRVKDLDDPIPDRSAGAAPFGLG